MSSVMTEMVDGVALLTLNRPQCMNAVNQELRSALISTLAQLDADETVNAIVITGSGTRAFCAGQDLDEAAATEWNQLAAWLNAQRAMYQAVRNLNKPCVAAINGVAAGAGFQIALCCDWRIASASSRIGQPEVKAGLASIVGSYLMSLYVSRTHNVQLSLSGDLVDGKRAYEIGLVTELVEPDAVQQSAIARARQLGALPKAAMQLSKQRLRATSQADFDNACIAGIAAQLQCYATGEPQQVMRDFLSARNNIKEPS